MKDFDQFLCDNKDNKVRVTKLKPLSGRDRYSGINTGESFVGQASLIAFEDHPELGDGVMLALNGGYTMRTSPVKGTVRKSPTKWLVKTLNSVYRVEVLK